MTDRRTTEGPVPPVSPALASSDVAVAILQPPDFIVTYANPAHLALYGWRIGSPPRANGSSSLPAPARSRALTEAVLDAAATVLRTGEPVRLGEAPAGEQYVQVVCSPIRADSTLTGVTIITVDVTEQVRGRKRVEDQHQRLSVLDEATAAVTAELDPRRELAALAESVVPALADACAVYLVEQPPSMPAETLGATRLICVIDPKLDITPPPPEARLRLAPTRPMARVVRTGRAVRAIGANADPKGWGEHWLTQLNPHSHVAVPIGTPDRVMAVISFAATGQRPQYEESDIALMHELTERVAVVVGRALRLQHTSEVALTLQRGLLSDPPDVPGLEIQVRYRPAGPGLEIGGDWYDAFRLPTGGLALTVGDVVGHDLYAASTMGQLRSMVQALACQPGTEPASVLTALNRLSSHLQVGELASAVHGRLNPPTDAAPATFTWANAGHPPPLLVGANVPSPILQPAVSPLLGLTETDYQQHRITLPADAVLLLYTDGLMEDPDRPSANAVSELADTAHSYADLGLAELCDRLVAGAPSRDDIALLAARVLP